jgi:hypothetical protein
VCRFYVASASTRIHRGSLSLINRHFWHRAMVNEMFYSRASPRPPRRPAASPQAHAKHIAGSLIPRILWQFLIHPKIASEEGLQRVVKAVQRDLSPFAFGGSIFLNQ